MNSTVRNRSKFQKLSKPDRSSGQASGTPSNTSAAPPSEPTSTPQANMPKRKPLFVFILLSAAFIIILWKSRRLDTQPTVSSSSPFGDVNIDQLDFSADSEKQSAIIASFKHAWNAYKRDAWGFDDYHPIAHKGANLSEDGGIGYTIVDALDTMLIMGLKDEFADAREWVATELTFDRKGHFNAFEITIRILGGLLSAYHLSGDSLFLEKAVDLGERMLPIFETNSGLPLSFIDLAERKGVADTDNRGMSSTAEAATLQLEFKYLSYLTDDYAYWKAVERVMDVIRKAGGDGGIVPIFMRLEDGAFITSDIRFGSRGDSYYEYLLKQYLQTNRAEPVYREMYDRAMEMMHKSLVQRTPANNLLYIAELVPKLNQDTRSYDWNLQAKQDHLVCFLGGSLLLGVTEGHGPFPPNWAALSAIQKRDWITGTELIKTCVATHDTQTGLSPEIAHFKTPGDPDAETVDWYIKGLDSRRPLHTSFDARYILRPETVESLFLAWRQTGDQKYREQGWAIFQSIEEHCKMAGGGYASILNVNYTGAPMEDKMETFFLSETLKYLYLLFSDSSLIPLDQYVFNTEAHPLPIFEPSIRTGH